MSSMPTLDRDRIRELFDLRGSYHDFAGGAYTADPYPVWHQLREQADLVIAGNMCTERRELLDNLVIDFLVDRHRLL